MATSKERDKAKTPAKTAPKKGRPAVGARSKGKRNEKTKATRKSPAANVSSHTSKGARAAKPKLARKPQASVRKPDSALATPDVQIPLVDPPRRGRPMDSPDVWTPEHIAEVAERLWIYILKTDCPVLAEFCFDEGINRRRIYEFPELLEVKDMLLEKRAAYFDKAGRLLSREDGPRGAFILRALANVGGASMVEKSETTEHVDSIQYFLPAKDGEGIPGSGERG